MATISDVAKKAGVSKATVSRVLNNTAIVNRETRKKILATIKALNYTPSFLAQGMRKQKTSTFGVVIPDFSNLYYSEFLKHVENEARTAGYTTIISSITKDPEKDNEYIAKLVERQQIEGLILCWYISVHEDRSFLMKLSKKLPIVIMDEPSYDLPISAVYSDQYGGLNKLTKYLINRGYKKIGIIKSLKKYSIGEARFNGYLDALKEEKIEINQDMIEESDWTVSDGYTSCNKLITKAKPEAIIGLSDLIAIGALMSVYKKGFSVPGDIAIAGYDDIPLARAVYPPLTTVRESIQEKANAAIGLLIRKIQNSRTRNKDITFKTELIIRDSA